MKTSVLFLACFLLVCGISELSAQTTPTTTYILPNGKVLPADKLDSLRSAWGPGRLVFSHNAKDDREGVMHLVKITDEMAQKMKEANTKRQQLLNDMVDKPAPGFALRDLNGKKWSLKNLKGKVVVLNFWFVTCPPCIQEMPELNELTKDYQSKEVVFLAMTYNDKEEVTDFLEDHTFDYNLLVDSHDTDQAYNVASWPVSFVIDKEGIVKFVVKGGQATIRQQLTKAIEQVL
ncbi:peroxiredoxin family protein [Chitinophaga pinensis]|uniref:Alkyl hydroperoxide reductase/ Thiol specific antioxidant/ Mal allergen n=1 Tax=Chitinophaga pinensis (strain ATCC 43595 / DSM 2588 / LMG 13176 / NBRC 15968 / NCIMB 11800 / UQM 2034) TaxID=485918 RepID=A0A979G2G1_CHIPD|nr:TlpA disulfide reductase family protein [Chitinophaga pinensis]ACU59697.1 alkyl hydroperoxide reductase/ Thiol specific antioxidant/ Mal allergen [Chitinophaga pinensis DSM 2588]